MDPTNQRLETGYEPIHVDVWRPDLRLSDGTIYTKFFTDSTVILSAIKVNDTNLYSASINIIGFLEMLTGKRFNYTAITLLIGLLGTLLSLSGVLEAFIPFLMALGLIFPPIAGVMLVDYYILRTSRHHLERSRKLGKLPNDVSMPITHLVAIISCALGSTVGVYLKYGIPSVNSFFAAGIIYWILMNIKSALRK